MAAARSEPRSGLACETAIAPSAVGRRKRTPRGRGAEPPIDLMGYVSHRLCGRDWKKGKHWGEFWEAYVLRRSISDWQALINISISALAL